MPKCPSRPINVSNSLALAEPLVSIFPISALHTMYLLSGSDMINSLKSIFQPSISISLTSSGDASAASLASASIASLGFGSLLWLGRAVVAIASKWAPALRSR